MGWYSIAPSGEGGRECLENCPARTFDFRYVNVGTRPAGLKSSIRNRAACAVLGAIFFLARLCADLLRRSISPPQETAERQSAAVVDMCDQQNTACALQSRPHVSQGCRQERGYDGQDPIVVSLMAQLQRSPSPPAVDENAQLLRVVQPTVVEVSPNCGRCYPPPRAIGTGIGRSRV